MSTPFEKFTVETKWGDHANFIVRTPVQDGRCPDNWREIRSERRRFIEDAIREKLERDRVKRGE